MIEKPKLLSGMMYGSDGELQVNHENIFSSFNKNKKDDVEIVHLERGNIYKNVKALPNQPNEIIVFEMVFEEKGFYLPSFKGFLYPNGTINGKIKYSLDAKLQDQLFDGIYQFNEKGKLVIYGNWKFDNVNNYVFISFSTVRKLVKKKISRKGVRKKYK